MIVAKQFQTQLSTRNCHSPTWHFSQVTIILDTTHFGHASLLVVTVSFTIQDFLHHSSQHQPKQTKHFQLSCSSGGFGDKHSREVWNWKSHLIQTEIKVKIVHLNVDMAKKNYALIQKIIPQLHWIWLSWVFWFFTEVDETLLILNYEYYYKNHQQNKCTTKIDWWTLKKANKQSVHRYCFV